MGERGVYCLTSLSQANGTTKRVTFCDGFMRGAVKLSLYIPTHDCLVSGMHFKSQKVHFIEKCLGPSVTKSNNIYVSNRDRWLGVLLSKLI